MAFLFTDIEGSTRRWEADPERMRADLAAHDEVLLATIEEHGGWMFKHTGDGVCAVFSSARSATEAAVSAQRVLGLPVRMGIAAGEAERRGDDYFGPPLNRAARVMAVGHGGQILLSAAAAALADGVGLIDLGEHRLRDLSGTERIHQVRADGLRAKFPALRTLDSVPGNLPRRLTSFVGREDELKQVAELVLTHQLVTLTGVGGVGKTRLAIQAAADLVPTFPDGVWLVELAAIGDPAGVPDAVASALGIVPQAGLPVTAGLAEAVAGRRMLLVLDNCEHVLDASAELVEALIAGSPTLRLIATSREGLRLAAEHLWPVPSMDVRDGSASAAVELFVERARAVMPGFDTAADVDSVIEICRRLDGIALAIELAAVRMVSMTPSEVLARLNDRFRLLSGSRRGLERHQTLRQAVLWSYELLADAEREVLAAGSVFAGGFDLASIATVSARFDEFTMLDLLDSLVRKSLVTATGSAGTTRYGLLETIRQFVEDQHSVTGVLDDLRDRHARHFAERAEAHWEIWDGPGYEEATDWFNDEFANLRTAFRWAADRHDIPTAAAIAAHTAMVTQDQQSFVAVGWSEELLPEATAAEISLLPRLLTAASLCVWAGRLDDSESHAAAAQGLEHDPRYRPFTGAAGTGHLESRAWAELFAGRADRCIARFEELASGTGVARLAGLCGLTTVLPLVGRSSEAQALADETMSRAHTHGNPFYIAYAHQAVGWAFRTTDPDRSLEIWRRGIEFAGAHRLHAMRALIGRDAAPLEARLGDPDLALQLALEGLDYFVRAGHRNHIPPTLAGLSRILAGRGLPELAATLYGASRLSQALRDWHEVTSLGIDLRTALGDEQFDRLVGEGEQLSSTEAASFARGEIALLRSGR